MSLEQHFVASFPCITWHGSSVRLVSCRYLLPLRGDLTVQVVDYTTGSGGCLGGLQGFSGGGPII